MAVIDVPGFGALDLRHLVLDYNGTIALDGEPLPGVIEGMLALSRTMEISVVTADTYGEAARKLEGAPCRLVVLPPGGQDEAKLACVRSLGAKHVAAMGNGRNDRLMLREAALGVAVIGEEGASTEAVLAADVVCPGILAAFDLLLRPLRLVAALRL